MSPLADRMAPVAERLGRLRGSIKTLFALDGLSRLVLALLAFAALTFLADWALDLPRFLRIVVLLGGLGLAGWILGKRVLKPLGVRISDDDLAIFVERNYPELNDKLISAIQLTRDSGRISSGAMFQNSPELVDALVQDAEQSTARLDFRSVIVRGHVGKIAAWAAILVALLAGSVAASATVRDYASRYVRRIVGMAVKWPQRNRLTVLDFPNERKVVARGDDLVVAVLSDGPADPSKVTLHYKFDTGEKSAERMTPLAGRRFQFLFTRVTGPFTFHVEGGDDTTADHRVEIVTPPSVDAVRVFYQYPTYMRKQNTPPDRPEAAGNVVAPFGTQVRFEALTNEDLKGATLLVGLKGKEKSSELQLRKDATGRDRVFGGGFEVTEASSEYELRLHARNGLSNRDTIRFAIKGLKDEPPRITVLDPVGDEFITELCERPLEIKVDDDYGIARIALEYRVLSQNPEKTSKDWAGVEFTRDQNSREYGELSIASQHVFDVARLKLAAGDHVELRFRSEDFKDVGGRNVTVGKTYKLSVVSLGTLEKELQDAIEKIKLLLRAQKAKQETAWNRTGNLTGKFGKIDLLTPEQQGEARQAGLDQNEITSKLDGARKDIRQIQRRGVYNKIYNETAAQKLQGAIDELDLLVGVTGELAKDGMARVAAARLDQAAKAKSGADRTDAFRDAQNRQSQVITGIQRAL
ncbi:MAG TPA: hypothetical protein VJB14_14445, partial [Planctomycetota bacterium]|nr:hypothetical protein [Planctomycetota bacterium]